VQNFLNPRTPRIIEPTGLEALDQETPMDLIIGFFEIQFQNYTTLSFSFCLMQGHHPIHNIPTLDKSYL
jgi:hypothetical protein